MGELFPLLVGLLAGSVLGLIRPSIRLLIGIPLAIGLGLLATFLSGEYEISWGFLLIDIPLVVISASVSLMLVKRLRLGKSVNLP